jgi:dienelactone hydrolase
MMPLLFALLVQAPQTAADREIRAWMTEQAKTLEKDFQPQIGSVADFEKARPKLREQYLDMLGLWPLPEKTPLKATVTGVLDFPGFKVEKLHYQSRPGLYVTGSLYSPVPSTGKHPAILYQTGHYNSKRDGHKSAVQDHGIWFATHGYVCLINDTIELGEVTVTHHGTYSQNRWWWQSAGYTPAGAECWNAIRGIDYLQSRADVDPERIGATGISGGGAATFWISAADERVKASAPVSGMSDLTWYVGEDGVNGHCDCMFLYNHHRWNWTSIAGLICPRPLLFTNSDADRIFPMPANERIIARLERLYSKFGASDRVDAMVSVGDHAMRTDLRRSIFEFFNRYLKGDLGPVTDADAGLGPDGKASRIPGVQLRVFPEDKDIPADQINTKLDETFVPLGKPGLPKAGAFEAWKKDLLDRVRATSFQSWAAETERPVVTTIHTRSGGGAPCMIVLNPDEDPDVVPEWAKPLTGKGPLTLLSPRTGWTRKNPPNTVERSMALIGTTPDAGRVWETMNAARRGEIHRVVGRGNAGIIAAYAALYEPSIAELVVVDPPTSHRSGPIFLSVLRVLDIPDALGCLAPRPLTMIGAKDPAFEKVAEIYKVAGAADQLTWKKPE